MIVADRHAVIAMIVRRAVIVRRAIDRRAMIVARRLEGVHAMRSSACPAPRTRAGNGRSAVSGSGTPGAAAAMEAGKADEHLAVQRRLD